MTSRVVAPPSDSSGVDVCHLGKYYPPAAGGMETHVRTLARAQARLGARVTVLCVNHRDRDGRDATWRRFAATPTTEDCDGPVRVVRVGRRVSLARLDVCPRLPLLLSRLGRQPGRLLHLHLPNPTMLLALAACRPALPVVVTYHSDVVRQKRLALLLRPFEQLVLGRAAAIVSNSPTYTAGSPLLPRYAEKVQVLPMGLDLGRYQQPSATATAFARQLRAAHGQPLWLAVGRLVYYKGLHNAIRALPLVPGQLLIVGDGPLRAELQRLASALGVASRVVWYDRLDDEELVGAYHAATALWFPSNARSEAFGLVQVEAMACGCPVINAAIPDSGVPWVSPHEETGLTVAVDDPAALAAAANRLLREPELRERLGTQGRTRAWEEFADDQMARRSLALYRAVLTGARFAGTTTPPRPCVGSRHQE